MNSIRFSLQGKTNKFFWSHILLMPFNNTYSRTNKFIKILVLCRLMADLLQICYSYKRIIELHGFSLLWEKSKAQVEKTTVEVISNKIPVQYFWSFDADLIFFLFQIKDKHMKFNNVHIMMILWTAWGASQTRIKLAFFCTKSSMYPVRTYYTLWALLCFSKQWTDEQGNWNNSNLGFNYLLFLLNYIFL